jgi:hypothetical protein
VKGNDTTLTEGLKEVSRETRRHKGKSPLSTGQIRSAPSGNSAPSRPATPSAPKGSRTPPEGAAVGLGADENGDPPSTSIPPSPPMGPICPQCLQPHDLRLSCDGTRPCGPVFSGGSHPCTSTSGGPRADMGPTPGPASSPTSAAPSAASPASATRRDLSSTPGAAIASPFILLTDPERQLLLRLLWDAQGHSELRRKIDGRGKRVLVEMPL